MSKIKVVRVTQDELSRPVTPVDQDRHKLLTRQLRRRRDLALMLAGDEASAAQSAAQALLTGYPAHATGESTRTRLYGAVIAITGIDPRALVAPGVTENATSGNDVDYSTNINISGLCDTSWDSTLDGWQQLLAMTDAWGLSRRDLRAAGLNLKLSWGKAVSNALKWFGERQKVIEQHRDERAGRDPKKGHKRVRRYRLDIENHQWIQKLSHVSTARAYGARIDPLGQRWAGQRLETWTGDEWQVAVDPETGWWRRVIDGEDPSRV